MRGCSRRSKHQPSSYLSNQQQSANLHNPASFVNSPSVSTNIPDKILIQNSTMPSNEDTNGNNINSLNIGDSFVNSQFQSPTNNLLSGESLNKANHDTSSKAINYLSFNMDGSASPQSSVISSSSTNSINVTHQTFIINQTPKVVQQQQNSNPTSTCQPSSSTNMTQHANEFINHQSSENTVKTSFLTEDNIEATVGLATS